MKITLEVADESQAASVLRFAERLAEVHEATMSAPDGQVLKICEDAVTQFVNQTGRDLIEEALQGRINAAEKKCLP